MRLVGFLIAVHAHMPNASRRDELEHAVDHTQSGTQDRNDSDLATGDLLGGSGADGRGHLNILKRKVARRLIALEQRKLLHQLAKLFGARLDVAHDGKLVLHHGVIDYGQAALVKFNAHISPIKKGPALVSWLP